MVLAVPRASPRRGVTSLVTAKRKPKGKTLFLNVEDIDEDYSTSESESESSSEEEQEMPFSHSRSSIVGMPRSCGTYLMPHTTTQKLELPRTRRFRTLSSRVVSTHTREKDPNRAKQQEQKVVSSRPLRREKSELQFWNHLKKGAQKLRKNSRCTNQTYGLGGQSQCNKA